MEPMTCTESPRKRERKSRFEGIVLRHARGCRSREGGRCSCSPSYQAQVWSARDQKTIRKTFSDLAAARSWRHESQVALRKGMLRSSSHLTLEEAAKAWLSAAEAGIVRTRTGEAYKPSAIRAYRQALTHRVLPTLGAKRLTAISHTMLQDFADQLSAQGLSASSARNTILPLRAIFGRAHRRNDVAVNPTLKLALPVVRSQRERACSAAGRNDARASEVQGIRWSAKRKASRLARAIAVSKPTSSSRDRPTTRSDRSRALTGEPLNARPLIGLTRKRSEPRSSVRSMVLAFESGMKR
jgi:hypothetical protein